MKFKRRRRSDVTGWEWHATDEVFNGYLITGCAAGGYWVYDGIERHEGRTFGLAKQLAQSIADEREQPVRLW